MLVALFNRQAFQTPNEAEQALRGWAIKYKKQPDGSLFVPRNLDISGIGLARLPDLSQVIVGGFFSCSNNQLTSLEGAPQTVGGGFYCSNNQLTSLEGAPHTVGGGFYCSNNQLTSLEHAPASIGGNFYFYFYFYCYKNQLTSLEHAPTVFKKLRSDFGKFSSWDAVPEELRAVPETKDRLEQEKQAQAETATVLQSAMRVRGPLKLQKDI